MRTRPFACNTPNQTQLACATGGLSGAQYHGDGNPTGLGVQQSYPSSHATFGFLIGRLLAYMVPEQEKAIMARAAEYGWHRVVLNAHFPKDVNVGGSQSGNLIADLLLNDPASLKQFDRAKQELRKQLCY